MSLNATFFCRVSFSIPVFAWGVFLLCGGYRFRYPSLRGVCFSCGVGIVFDTHDYGGAGETNPPQIFYAEGKAKVLQIKLYCNL